MQTTLTYDEAVDLMRDSRTKKITFSDGEIIEVSPEFAIEVYSHHYNDSLDLQFRKYLGNDSVYRVKFPDGSRLLIHT